MKGGSTLKGPRWLRPLSPSNKALVKKKGFVLRKGQTATDEAQKEEEREFQQDRVGPGRRQVMPEWWQSAAVGDASSSKAPGAGSSPQKMALNPYVGPMGLYGESSSLYPQASGLGSSSIREEGSMNGIEGQDSQGRRLKFLDQAAAEKGGSKQDLMNRIANIHR